MESQGVERRRHKEEGTKEGDESDERRKQGREPCLEGARTRASGGGMSASQACFGLFLIMRRIC